jgi:alcohol dehydrogenase
MNRSRVSLYLGGSKKQPGPSFELRDMPTPTPRAGEVLVRNLGCTICGSDLHTVRGDRAVPTPTILGHEITGEVAACGPGQPVRDVDGGLLREGDRVVWCLVAACGSCLFCERGLPQKCVRGMKYGHAPFEPGHELHGGLAEHCILVPGTAIVRLPQGLPLELACPASCATATVVAALEAAGDVRGRAVCVLGAGLLGLTAVAMARDAGARDVVSVDVQPSRLERARALGATHAVTPGELPDAVAGPEAPSRFDVALELTGSPDAFRLVWPRVETGGVIVAVGAVFPSPAVALPLEELVRRQLTLKGVHNYAPRHLQRAVEWLAATPRQQDLAALVTAWYPLADVARAFEAAAAPEHVRVGVRLTAARDAYRT